MTLARDHLTTLAGGGGAARALFLSVTPGAGPSAATIAAAVLAAAAITPISCNVKEVNDVPITGTGVPPTFDVNGAMTDPGDPWVPV